jgi:acyl-CoA thioesterase FadM
MTQAVWDFDCHLPRYAFTARDAPRAGDLWRAFQDVAVEGSARAGFGPERFRALGTAFVVRTMTVRHHREPDHGEALRARTWVATFQRGIISVREIRIESDRGPIAAASQQWVYVGADQKPTRADPELLDAYHLHDGEASVVMPEYEPLPGPVYSFDFDVWYTWMDPLDHVNHPTYVDFCDEATARIIADRDIVPLRMRPVAETVTFRAALVAGDRVRVETDRIGVSGDGIVLRHRIIRGDGVLCADATFVRSLVDEDVEALVDAFGAPLRQRSTG